MMNHNMKVHWLLALPAMLLAVGCGESALPEEGPDEEERVELQVSPQVALTRSAIQGTDAATDGAAMGSIAVYASNATTNNATNNYGLYAYSGGSWSNSGTDKIYLSAEEANIYAHYPAYKPGTGGVLATSGEALKVNGSGQVTANSTVNISVFPGTESNENSKITAADNATGDAIVTAPGEVDYMYADQTSTPKASYKKGVSGKDGKVTLSMKHALAMVSFRVYADHTYKNTGALTKLVLANKSGTILNSGGTNPTMKISDGAITPGSSPAAVTYTRGISNYTLQKASADTDAARTTAQNASKKVSILVLPESTQDKTNVEVTLKIDNQDYAVSLGNAATNAWTAGNNYLYTVKLSGKELSITNVTVTKWNETPGGSLDIQ
ncbi:MULTISPECIES: fimbrillin family protein [unclassified Bacteroides]|uniref:fimbrillin family protein n=1 Tax=unclassified Bacteroides TaxID=2646097 RepID=UPI0013EA5006|nr:MULTISPECIES: fimbrillin family protein [unclassified Bacteroides]QTO25311.1 fimbrillin family protein [Bacteroides sp. ZJ-18]